MFDPQTSSKTLGLVFRFIPAIDSLRTYTWNTFRRDLMAGLTVAAVAVPQAMAYATIFGVPEQYGLYTAIIMTAIGAMLDSSKQLINGPTNAISIALLSALAAIPAEDKISAAITMAFLIGLVQTGITLMRLGDLSRFISHAVIIGFTLGASVLLVLDQTKNFLGLKNVGGSGDHFLVRFWQSLTQGGDVSWRSVAIGVITFGIALGLRQVNRRWRLGVPELLTALVGAAGLAFLLGWDSSLGVKLVSEIPRELPSFSWPNLQWQQMYSLLGSALAIAMLGLLEAIAMAKSIAQRTGQKLDINQQCLSEGLANLGGSFFQCFPGSGSLTRSYINYQSGAATQWSGVFSAAAVALVVLALAPLAKHIPRPALAAILLLTATRMFELSTVRYYLKATRFDAVIVIATAISAVLISVEFCVLIGVFLSFVFYVPKAAKIEATELIISDQNVIREKRDEEKSCSRLRIYNVEGQMFFGASSELEEILQRIYDDSTGAKIILLRAKYVHNPDAVCIHLLSDFVKKVQAREQKIALCGVRNQLNEVLVNCGVDVQIGKSQIFIESNQVWSSTLQAVSWAYEQLGGNYCETCPKRNPAHAGLNDWSFEI